MLSTFRPTKMSLVVVYLVSMLFLLSLSLSSLIFHVVIVAAFHLCYCFSLATLIFLVTILVGLKK